jgi:hypothetical protein
MVGPLNSAEPSREPATIRWSEAAGGLVVLIDRFLPLSGPSEIAHPFEMLFRLA